MQLRVGEAHDQRCFRKITVSTYSQGGGQGVLVLETVLSYSERSLLSRLGYQTEKCCLRSQGKFQLER